jgi:hypothetical protein
VILVGASTVAGVIAYWVGPARGSGTPIHYMVMLIAVIVIVAALHPVYQIRVTDDGHVSFTRMWGRTTTVAARDIHELEGRYQHAYDGDHHWHLRIRYRAGMVTCDAFEDVLGFIGEVQRHNPTVEITGLWPMGFPVSR